MADLFDVPKWISKLVYDWKQKLGLYEWRIFLKMANAPNDYHRADGAVRLESQVNEAHIEFKIGLEDEPYDREAVVHEVLHIVHARIDKVVTDVIIEALPEACQSMALEAYRSVVEPYTQHMAVHLLKLEREAFEAGVKRGKKKAREK